jgi:ABC-type amino acid transport substrate-binding protein
MKYGLLAGLVFTTASHASIDLKANEQPLPVTVDRQAVAKIPANYKFVEPGTLTVAVSALNSPPLALLASDNRTRIGRPGYCPPAGGQPGAEAEAGADGVGRLAAGDRLRALRRGAGEHCGDRTA